MVDKILEHKEDLGDELSGDEQPKRPVFQIVTTKKDGDQAMEETKE